MALSAWVVAYDIHDNRTRCRCLRALRGHAEGYQKSVFEMQEKRDEMLVWLDTLACELDIQDSLFAARTLPYQHAWQLGTGFCSPSGDLLVIS
ncbi:CRISPR-associated endonuclease Cas2 [Halomonas sp. GFAJ-1]|uniref:CRISPR-associated endonuclease Cas2 n=1 Tax=Halomonas sp. GFAJ-1 TaxID=1118153 RepID=UPI00023A33CE|nr:CRISPR-associated endonuclease Cas2 [Halomonas sp. GFAJ-1]AVI62982.1 hypothetical protein BB497_09900 [Halomonas sp. GFAJ-1]EHK60290.1 hypothetical protein MOY_11342 [Halomonas sp. GFAJ-1]